MARNRFGIDFSGFAEMMEDLDRLGGDLKKTAKDCLEVAHETVTPRVKADMTRHKRTGRTERSIYENKNVEWEGNAASIAVGFTFQEGLASVFLMYGTPRMKKDRKLYNDIYGRAVQKKIEEEQAKIVERAISERLGG